MDEKLLKKYFTDQLESATTLEERLDLIFLITGEKPGAVIMGVEKQDIETLENFAEDFNLELEVRKGGERGFVDRILGRDTRAFKDTAFLAKNRERFDALEEQEPGFTGYTDRSVGEFLGYPENALKFYAETDVPGKVFRQKTGENQDDMKYLSFLSYLPAPESETIEKAIEKGKNRAENLEELHEEHETDLFLEYRQKALEEGVKKFR